MEKAKRIWAKLQYRGDAEDIRSLYENYNVDGFLRAREADERDRGGSLRSHLLKDGVLLNSALSPRIYSIVRRVQEALRLEGDFDVFCTHEEELNAFAHLEVDNTQTHHVVAITSGALESLDDDEIAFLLGHEFGHFVYGHNRLLGLLNRDDRNERITVLPYLGECLFLRWRKKSEVSADRLGLVACRSFDAAARALLKVGFGLSAKNLNLNVDSLLEQIEAIKDKPEILEAAYRSHPLLPIRLKALSCFSPHLDGKLSANIDKTDAEVARLFEWLKRYPRKPLHEAVMRIVALAGMRVIGIDQDVDEEEIRTIIYVLHAWFTDTPEAELILDPGERKARWLPSVELIRREGDDDDRRFIISRLADIALADGKLLQGEAGVILETAEAIGMSPKHAYAIMVGAAQAVGFKADYQMKEIARQVRGQIMALAAR